MQRWIRSKVAAALACSLLAAPAAAHMPSLVDGAFADWREPFVVGDIEWSQVVYHRAGCETPTLWMRLQADAGQALFVQLGTPELERQFGRQLQLVVLGPGLGDTVPAGLEGSGAASAEVFEATVAHDTPTFHEPFSDTHSRILVEKTLTLPAAGTYYVAARFLDGQAGKLWVSTGTVEKFDADAIKRVIPLLDEVKRFHETIDDPWAPTDGVDATCPAPVEIVEPAAAGCHASPSTAATGTGWLAFLGCVMLLLGRRRSVEERA